MRSNTRISRHILPGILMIIVLLVPFSAKPQGQSFQEFRQGLLNDYNSFRSGILADYARFLDGIWVEYDGFRGKERVTSPKPESVPEISGDDNVGESVVLEMADDDPVEDVLVTTLPAPAMEERETNSIEIFDPSDAVFELPVNIMSWKGVEIPMQDIDLSDIVGTGRLRNFGNRWKTLARDPRTEQLVRIIKTKAVELGLNDYLTFDFVMDYVADRYADCHSTSQMSLVHYIMANLGYDVRLAKDGKGDGVLLAATRQMIYGRAYMLIDGTRYFIFSAPGKEDADEFDRISTCRLPKGAKLGDKLDLQLGKLNLPYSPHNFAIQNGSFRISGEVNANIFPLLHRYPQMQIGEYAHSVIDPDLRADIVRQFKEQLNGRETRQAVDSLLRFVHFAFDYATDQATHGFEKPYFFEEILYYPTCDCEDRAIFYTYLLWNVLGLESHVIGYPGHEAASVCINDGKPGVEYRFQGKDYFISDPTYRGSVTGMCMSAYKTVLPSVDYKYE